jgi:hypothetical protein
VAQEKKNSRTLVLILLVFKLAALKALFIIFK